MLTNPRPPFPHWFELRQDILFNGLTIDEAANKYGINKRSIHKHLKKSPRIKDAYYDRPWATKQLQIQFIPKICARTHEAVDDIYIDGGSLIYAPGSPEHKKVMAHLITCDSCQEYESYIMQVSRMPYRFDCPSLASMALSKNKMDITEHFLICTFCKVEYDGLKSLSNHSLNALFDKEFDFYPHVGWQEFLTTNQIQIIKDILENPIFKAQGIPPEFITTVPNATVQSYFRWRIFRVPLFEIGLTTE
jgi:hypothetical protein